MPSKDQFLDAWEKPCIEAAKEEWNLSYTALGIIYRAIAPMLLGGLAEVEVDRGTTGEPEPHPTVTLYRLEEPSE